MKLPATTEKTKITAIIHIEKKSDDMDRLGNVHLKLTDGSRLELIHYITSFGGKTDHLKLFLPVFGNGRDTKIHIIDMRGRIMQISPGNSHTGEVIINLDSYLKSSGVYLACLNAGSVEYYFSFVFVKRGRK